MIYLAWLLYAIGHILLHYGAIKAGLTLGFMDADNEKMRCESKAQIWRSVLLYILPGLTLMGCSILCDWISEHAG